MIDGIEILTAALQDFGVDATLNLDTLRIIPYLKGRTELGGDLVEHTRPYAVALKSAVEALRIVPETGNLGDTITILGRDFMILSIDDDDDGGVILLLEEKAN